MHLKRLLANCSMCRSDPNVIAYVQRNPFFPAHTYLNLNIMYVKANFTNNSFCHWNKSCSYPLYRNIIWNVRFPNADVYMTENILISYSCSWLRYSGREESKSFVESLRDDRIRNSVAEVLSQTTRLLFYISLSARAESQIRFDSKDEGDSEIGREQ